MRITRFGKPWLPLVSPSKVDIGKAPGRAPGAFFFCSFGRGDIGSLALDRGKLLFPIFCVK